MLAWKCPILLKILGNIFWFNGFNRLIWVHWVQSVQCAKTKQTIELSAAKSCMHFLGGWGGYPVFCFYLITLTYVATEQDFLETNNDLT